MKLKSREYFKFLFNGQKVDWQYSIVTILIIVGLVSTPLILGSIKNKTYQSLKNEVETINNAKQISIASIDEFSENILNSEFAAELSKIGFSGYGNREFYMRVSGPVDAKLSNVATLSDADPLIEVYGLVWLSSELAERKALALDEIVLSDSVGVKVFGGGKWAEIKSMEAHSVSTVEVSINDSVIKTPFKVVGYIDTRSVAFIGPKTSSELNAFTLGFGSKSLGLVADRELSTISLPKISSNKCMVLIPNDQSCSLKNIDSLKTRISDLEFKIETNAKYSFLEKGMFSQWLISPDAKNSTRSCKSIIEPQALNYCSHSSTFDYIEFDNATIRNSASIVQKWIGVDSEFYNAQALRDVSQLGLSDNSLLQNGTMSFSCSENCLVDVKQLKIRDSIIPLTRSGNYSGCSAERCPIYSDIDSVYRLINLQEGSVATTMGINNTDLILRSTKTSDTYEEILTYSKSIESVENDVAKLQGVFGEGLKVDYNYSAIKKLERSNSRMEALFQLTMVFSVFFLLLSLSALSKINIERRSRQVAQMLILGYKKNFVQRLIVGEYITLTLLGVLSSVIFSSMLCLALRAYLVRDLDSLKGGDESFRRVIESLSVDFNAFIATSIIVMITTVVVGFVTAFVSTKADPIQLLD